MAKKTQKFTQSFGADMIEDILNQDKLTEANKPEIKPKTAPVSETSSTPSKKEKKEQKVPVPKVENDRSGGGATQKGSSRQQLPEWENRFRELFTKPTEGVSERTQLVFTERNKNRLELMKMCFDTSFQDLINNMIENTWNEYKDLLIEKQSQLNKNLSL